METKDQENTQNKPAETHPKPTEDVQLDIETVTPDTEKEGLPNDQKNNNPTPNQKPTDQDSSKEEKPDDINSDENKEGSAEGTKEPETENNDDQPADDIETVSP
ncbi:hypothetical protein [Pedobacter metabolipauper]|uniref:Uncharacterized protein n=1 Tax=Pedobacter metabolipauper TaxID=425513 RepID=A0A4R6SZM0_9SPHI|nr:hypothetical protein [Pedobacter metabolipauper]TDQ11542.1 hypothetical protein ATK78_0665 [Pedobacter metabolipauper]